MAGQDKRQQLVAKLVVGQQLPILVPGLPRVKEWAYAGFFFDLTGAAATRAFVGDGAADILAPLVFLGLVMASRALAPARLETVNLAEAVAV